MTLDPNRARIYGWAFGCTAAEVPAMTGPFGARLGAVLYRDAYDAAKSQGSWVAWMGSPADAEAVAALAQGGAHFDGAIYLDEANGPGKLTGRQYVQKATAIAATLKAAGVPFWGMSTRGLTSGADLAFLRTVDGLMDLPVACWNPGGTRERILAALATKDLGPWFLSPHPWRFTLWPINDCAAGNWFLDLLHGLTSGWYARKVATHANVKAVAFWSLKAYGRGHFGLYNKRGRLTLFVGRPVWRAVMGNRRYPVVRLP